ncbi:hypothetical protein ACEPAF_1352 [Sanghuangporus sanghuang]
MVGLQMFSTDAHSRAKKLRLLLEQTFALLSNEILGSYGYSADTVGLMERGAALLLPGPVTALATSPLFDRILTGDLGHSARIVVLIIVAAWLLLIWTVRPTNTGALFAIFVIIGICSVSTLPVALGSYKE